MLTQRRLALPRAWVLTARLLEIAAVVLLAGAAHEMWVSWSAADGFYSTDGNIHVVQRLTNIALFTAFRGINILVAALLAGAVVAMLLWAHPVAHARILRWEALGVALAAGLLALSNLVAILIVALFGIDSVGGTGYVGPDLTSQLAGSAPLPVAGVLLAAVAGVWWMRLPAEFEEPAEDPPLRSRRSAPPQEAAAEEVVDTDSPFAGSVEQLEPVERIHLRERRGTDGATSSGYDDYFRRS